MTDQYCFPSLEGVIVGETAIATIEGGLQYRGYAIEDLARDTTFIEVAYLLLNGELPSQEQLADFRAVLVDSAKVPAAILSFMKEVPIHVSPMDVLRTAISAAGHFDPQVADDSSSANIAKTLRLLAWTPVLIAARHRYLYGLPLLEPNSELSYSANLLNLITGQEPSPLQEHAMDVLLILYAEHEFNASTFTARVVTSTRSDLYSAVVAAVGALKGPVHSGANERVMDLLKEVGAPDNAERWVRDALEKKRRIMGFGHRVYKVGDSRAAILKDYCSQLAEQDGQTDLEEIAGTIERIIRQEKGLLPNLDWPSARLYHYLGLEVEMYTPLFVVSRVVGWAAHVIEQSEDNRLIWPRSRYTGPAKRKFVPLLERG